MPLAFRCLRSNSRSLDYVGHRIAEAAQPPGQLGAVCHSRREFIALAENPHFLVFGEWTLQKMQTDFFIYAEAQADLLAITEAKATFVIKSLQIEFFGTLKRERRRTSANYPM